jgi:hypothetical protein
MFPSPMRAATRCSERRSFEQSLAAVRRGDNMTGLAMIIASIASLWFALPRNGQQRWPLTNSTVNAGVALAVVTGLAVGGTLVASSY